MPSKYEEWEAAQEAANAEWIRVASSQPVFTWPLGTPEENNPTTTVRVEHGGLQLYGRLPVVAVPSFVAWLKETFE